MNKDIERDLELQLLQGREVQFERLYIRPLTLNEINVLGLQEYESTVNFLRLTKKRILSREEQELYKDYSFFQVVMMKQELCIAFMKFLYLFVEHDDGLDSIQFMSPVESFIVKYKGN